jgi:hypothetical protein
MVYWLAGCETDSSFWDADLAARFEASILIQSEDANGMAAGT